MRILKRIIRWTEAGLRIEADPRHVEILIKEMGLNEANSVKTPGVKDRERDDTKRATSRQIRSQLVPAVCSTGKFIWPKTALT